MVAGRLGEDARAMHDSAALGVLRAKAQRLQSGDRDSRGAHRARLERHPQGAFVEPRRAERLRRGADRLHLRMGGRVGRAAHRVAALGDDFVAASDDRADRHFAGRRRLGGEVERAAHRQGQRKGHGRAASSAARAVSYIALLVTGAAWLSAGRWTSSFGTFTVVSFEPTFTEPVCDVERRRLPALGRDAVAGRGDLRRPGAADLVDVEKAGRDRGDDGDHDEDEDEEDRSHGPALSRCHSHRANATVAVRFPRARGPPNIDARAPSR